ALSWLVYRLTGSATLLGAVGFASQIPIFGLSPIGRGVSDRYPCPRILLLTQSLAPVPALVLAPLPISRDRHGDPLPLPRLGRGRPSSSGWCRRRISPTRSRSTPR